jgi:hypothetical protein
MSDLRIKEDYIALEPGPCKGTFIDEFSCSADSGEVGEGDNGPLCRVFEE